MTPPIRGNSTQTLRRAEKTELSRAISALLLLGTGTVLLSHSARVISQQIPAAQFTAFEPVVGLSGLDGKNGFVLRGIDESDRAGDSVSGAGDVNGDGIPDLIIAAPLASPNGNFNDDGETYVVFGGAGVGASGVTDLSSLDGTSGFVVNGTDGTSRSTNSVSDAGDVNGDGFDDLIIGAFNAGPAGESYVVFGGPDVGGSGVIELSDLNGTNGVVIKGASEAEGSGYSVSSPGDINADGLDDLIISNLNSPDGPVAFGDPRGTEGENYVVFGSTSLGSTPSIELSNLNGSNGFVINGTGSRTYSASDIGDVNGDGIDDIVIGVNFFYDSE